MSDNLDELQQKFFNGRAAAEAPLVALRDAVVFPRAASTVVVSRRRSVRALEAAMRHDRLLVLAVQKQAETETAGPDDICRVGVLVRVREATKQPDRSVRLLVDGLVRVRITGFASEDPYLRAVVELYAEPAFAKTEQVEAAMYSVLNQFRQAVNMGANVPFESLIAALNAANPWLLGDIVAANLEMKAAEKQEILEAATVESKLDLVGRALGRQLRLLQMASKIQAETGKELDKMQREAFLREEMRAIERELEDLAGRTEDELQTRLEAAGLPPAVKEKALKEYDRLRTMPTFSPEIAHLRAYLEWLADLPWQVKAGVPIDLAKAKKILDADHDGLDKAKERVLEHLAVQKLVGKTRGPILCFVGPPGTGKTSIGRSVARALGRKFWRVSLGGIRDEAEIRGHRRTYVGALPGRIIQGIAAVKARNPVFMLDEIDKIGTDFRGDPSAALLEALDTEQNHAFSDHYLEVPFDLSDVMFIATANLLDTVPPALRDRLEVIEFPGYTEAEKLRIAKNYLVPKVFRDNGLAGAGRGFTDGALRTMVRGYTLEAGVRGLERVISAVGRKLARRLAEGRRITKKVTEDDLSGLLGPEKFSGSGVEERDIPGVVVGLAWTEAGGDILNIEAASMPGKGGLTLTGHLGEVMKESAQAALSFVRSSAGRLGLPEGFFKDLDVHLHVPAGAIPKDGPSAGAAMAVALVSLFRGVAAGRKIGVTGEITLRGRILEVGGVKEKILAAHRAGLKTVVLPAKNRKDLVEVPAEVRRQLKFVFVEDIDDVLAAVLPAAGTSGRRGRKQADLRHPRRRV